MNLLYFFYENPEFTGTIAFLLFYIIITIVVAVRNKKRDSSLGDRITKISKTISEMNLELSGKPEKGIRFKQLEDKVMADQQAFKEAIFKILEQQGRKTDELITTKYSDLMKRMSALSEDLQRNIKLVELDTAKQIQAAVDATVNKVDAMFSAMQKDLTGRINMLQQIMDEKDQSYWDKFAELSTTISDSHLVLDNADEWLRQTVARLEQMIKAPNPSES